MERAALLSRKISLRLQVPGWLFLIPALLGIGIAVFCVYYLAHNHGELQAQYLQLNPCIYNQSSWKSDFFNQATKSSGNKHAVIGMVCASALIFRSLFKWFKERTKPVVQFSYRGKDILAVSALLFWTAALWMWGFYTSVPAYDEVFSAVNCANAPVAHTISYYMLPNNHVLFNLLNNLAFHPIYDKVATGRIISGLSQGLLTILLYWWIFNKVGHRGYAALYCALLLLQFPVWGFSFQARGYSMYLLCCWLSAISLEQYFRNPAGIALYFHTIAIIIGFAVMPPFLMWYAALVLVIIGWTIFRRKIDMRLAGAHMLAGVCVYLFYLPAIAYSGLAALTDNPYVAVIHSSFKEFWERFSYGFGASIQYCFGADVDGHNKLYIMLFALPVLLLPFLRRKPSFTPVIFYITVWAAFLMLQLKMRHYPFMRNMIAHDSITLAAILLSVHFAAQVIGRRFKIARLLPVVSIVFCVVAGVHFMRFMRGHVHDSLYFYKAESQYEAIRSTLSRIPQSADVWCSDKSFYPQYVLRRRGLEVGHCAAGSQQYFVTDSTEGEPPMISGVGIRPVDSVLQYFIYRRVLP